jgi:hypothetical protein
MQIAPKNYYGGITEEHVIHFEQRIGARLPEEYRQFLIRYNGGWFEKRHVLFFNHFAEKNQFADLNVLHGISSENNKLMGTGMVLVSRSNRQPPQVIVIGNNSGTGLFCLAVRGENYGKIYFWDDQIIYGYIEEEEDASEAERDMNNVFWLADSFHEFIAKLEEDPYE